MTTTPAKSRQQNASRFIKTTLLLSTLLLSLSGQLYAAYPEGANARTLTRAESAHLVTVVNNYKLEIDKTLSEAYIKNKISDSFGAYNHGSCIISLFIERDGTLSNVVLQRGQDNVILCGELTKFIQSVKKVPAPPSDEIFQGYFHFPVALDKVYRL